MTTKFFGTSGSSSTSRLVTTKPPMFSRTPGMGGTTAEEPEQMIIFAPS